MIIVGLGNPGKKYEGTRHNVGFEVVDQLVEKLNGSWKNERDVTFTKVSEDYFIKPQKFMNESGSALLDFLKYKGLMDYTKEMKAQQLLWLVHDDLDFPLGELHPQLDRSAGGHNGVQSIIEALGTQDFHRLRIGIGNNREAGTPSEEYVLQKFSQSERSVITQGIAEAVELLSKKIRG